VLPANVRLDWKVIARYKHSSLLGLMVSNEGKSFITLTIGDDVIKQLAFIADLGKNKLERLPRTSFLQASLICKGKKHTLSQEHGEVLHWCRFQPESQITGQA
jgi:hypothetical protein